MGPEPGILDRDESVDQALGKFLVGCLKTVRSGFYERFREVSLTVIDHGGITAWFDARHINLRGRVDHALEDPVAEADPKHRRKQDKDQDDLCEKKYQM